VTLPFAGPQATMVRRVLWVRVGNTSNRKLIELALRALPAIIDTIERDEAIIEFVGR